MKAPSPALILLCLTQCVLTVHGGPMVPPPKPHRAPLISERYPNDSDGDGVDDELLRSAQQAVGARRSSVTSQKRSAARLDEMVDVELIFREPITQKQIDTFVALGGKVTYLYRAVSYGWNGRIPLSKVPAIRAAMGTTLALVDRPQEMVSAMLEATRTGRVRPTWATGFAGSTSGFSGDTNITIAFLDTGVDETHMDLAGRMVYSTNFTDEPTTIPNDVAHGSHVAAIAVGSGAASGNTTSTLLFTQFGTLAGLADQFFYVAPMELPSNPVSVRLTGKWNGGGNTGMALTSYDKGTKANLTNATPIFGLSPLTRIFTVTGQVNRVFTPRLNSNGSNTEYVVTGQASNYPSAGDGFNKLRGVAPGCNWADARVARPDGTGLVPWVNAAIDDLIAQRVEKNVKVINLSRQVNGDPGINLSLRQKVNSAVNNGVVFVVPCGNDNRTSNFSHEIDDPGRAALALTVAGANDVNQLTDYSSHGFDPSLAVEQDHKPDLIAPGGSSYYTYILSAENNNNDFAFPDQQLNDYESFRGTSRASPFAAGCAALVIQAMEKRGLQWDFNSSLHSLFVKMVLCATATESNLPREAGGFDPSLDRAAPGPDNFPAGKDPYEGYGMINTDAAIEAVYLTYTNGVTNSASLGGTPNDRRAWARMVNLQANQLFIANLAVPPTGDFDLYLYSTPTTNGTPVILGSGTQEGNGVDETLTHVPATNSSAILVVKRVSGAGTFDFVGMNYPAPQLILPTVNGDEFTFSFATIAARTYIVEFKNALDDPAWQTLQTLPGDGTTKTVTNLVSAAGQRFFRLTLQ